MANPTLRKIAVTTAGLMLSAGGVFGVLVLEGRFARAEAPRQVREPPARPVPADATAEPPPGLPSTLPLASPPPVSAAKATVKKGERKLRPVRGY